MKTATMATEATGENIIPLAVQPKPRTQANRIGERFTIQTFINPRTKTESYRVTGIKRNGERIRQNFTELLKAQTRQQELNLEYLSGHQTTGIKATRLTDVQVKLAESVFVRLDSDEEILLAVDHWLNHGKKNAVTETKKLDDAHVEFVKWLDTPECGLRTLSKKNLKRRVGIFIGMVPNIAVSDVTPDVIEKYLAKRDVSPKSKDNDRRAVSRFFGWCIERSRRWAMTNPCREVTVTQGEESAPAILTLDECERLMKKAASHKRGVMAPYAAVCLFGGLRPFEAARLSWDQVNLQDKEIRLEPWQTKTGRGRVVSVCDTLAAWLTAFEKKEFFPSNWRRDLDAIKVAAGLVKTETAKSKGTIDKTKKGKLVKAHRYWKKLIPVNWKPDIMRHTAISHYFRKTGSYGETAEQFGNSEAIIKAHYQARVSTDETQKFYSILPKSKKGTK